jgi:hypothetical protein
MKHTVLGEASYALPSENEKAEHDEPTALHEVQCLLEKRYISASRVTGPNHTRGACEMTKCYPAEIH